MSVATLDITAVNEHERPLRVAPGRGWVLYDGRCRMCRAGARLFGRALKRRGFDLQPLQRAWVVRTLRLPSHALLHEMRVLMNDGRALGGADAVLHLSRLIWWMRPLRVLARMPGGMPMLRWMYRALADRRGCTEGVCGVESKPSSVLMWMPAAIVFVAGLALGPLLPRWGWMWALAFSLYVACKWPAWRKVDARVRSRAGLVRNLGFLVAWPGMDSGAFLDRRARTPRPRSAEWISAILKMAFGIAIVWGVCRLLPIESELLMGWVGMVGLILVLHFGAFHVLSLGWRQAGVNAPHLFRWPIASTSLGDFWGNRWNGGFNQLAHDFVFRPLRRRAGVSIATLATFLVSGLVHDLVISVPAGGGFGLPTAYFVAQGFGMFAERSQVGRRIGLRQGLLGRAYAVAMVAGPAYWLFHPPFVRNVIVPFLDAIGSI
jgi:predicted DCC family thiol-disulfide oxidoreductase YuxK